MTLESNHSLQEDRNLLDQMPEETYGHSREVTLAENQCNSSIIPPESTTQAIAGNLATKQKQVKVYSVYQSFDVDGSGRQNQQK